MCRSTRDAAKAMAFVCFVGSTNGVNAFSVCKAYVKSAPYNPKCVSDNSDGISAMPVLVPVTGNG